MTHLDELAAALVDHEVSYEQRDRAYAHLAGCPSCRAEVDTQRRIKALMARQVTPEPDAELFVRLLAVPGHTQLEVSFRRTPLPAGPDRPAAGRPAAGPRILARPAPRPVPARSRRRAAARSVSALAVACGVAVLLGGEAAPTPVRPPASTFVQDHNATTTNLPIRDPGEAAVSVNFAR